MHAARMGNMNTYRIFVGKPEGKSPFERRRSRWEDNIENYPKEMDERACTGLILQAAVNKVMSFRIS
jgi:hypothetical protein